MEIITMIVVGVMVGALAKIVMPGRDSGGVLLTMALGIAGAVAAGLIGREMGWYARGDRVGIIASVGGAILLLALHRMVFGRRLAG